LITSGLGGYGLSVAASADQIRQARQVMQFGRTISSLARQFQNSPTAMAQFEGEPYGYRETGTRVYKAINNPEVFITYLGLDTSSEMPEEVRRLEQLVGRWNGETTTLSKSGRKMSSGEERLETEKVCGGWLISSKVSASGSGFSSASHAIMGWCPNDDLYHLLSYQEGREGSSDVLMGFTETTMRYDPESRRWYGESTSITNNNYFVKVSTSTRVEQEGTIIIESSAPGFDCRGEEVLHRE